MSTKLYPIFLHLALIGLAATTLAVVQENRRLVEQMTPDPPRLELGTVIAPVAAVDLDGTPRTLAWDAAAKDRLLLVFTTSCPACKQNLEAWVSLHRELGGAVEVVGISLSDAEATRAYVDAYDLPFDVVLAANSEALAVALEVQLVPFTVWVDSEGHVRGVWEGVLFEKTRERAVASIQGQAQRG
ncbi:MAG: TlpA disulfide reductase family protein [Acidobacteriota bacterium]